MAAGQPAEKVCKVVTFQRSYRRITAIQKRHVRLCPILLAIFPSKGYYHTHIFCWENVAFARFHALPRKRTADFLY